MLANILDDIHDASSLVNVSQLGLESQQSATTTSQRESVFKLSTGSFDKKLVTKFNQLYQLVEMKKSISQMSKLDRGVALEVFTMIPGLAASTSAKVTTRPTELNRKVVLDVLASFHEVVPEETLTSLRNVKMQLDEVYPYVLEIGKHFDTFMEQFGSQIERLRSKPPMIVSLRDKKSYNLLTTSVVSWTNEIDFNQCGYAKYENDAMVQKANTLVYDRNFYNFVASSLKLDLFKDGGSSLEDIYEAFKLYVVLVKEQITSITSYKERLDVVLTDPEPSQETNPSIMDDVNDVLNSTERVLGSLTELQAVHNEIDKQDSLFEKLLALVTFID